VRFDNADVTLGLRVGVNVTNYTLNNIDVT
jgi:hypothetical protein